MFTGPHAFFATGAGIRVLDVHVATMYPIHFYKNICRANSHTFPAALAQPGRKTDVLRFTKMKKGEYIHKQSWPQYTKRL